LWHESSLRSGRPSVTAQRFRVQSQGRWDDLGGGDARRPPAGSARPRWPAEACAAPTAPCARTFRRTVVVRWAATARTAGRPCATWLPIRVCCSAPSAHDQGKRLPWPAADAVQHHRGQDRRRAPASGRDQGQCGPYQSQLQPGAREPGALPEARHRLVALARGDRLGTQLIKPTRLRRY
jgi:hypothetical protein